MKNSIELNLFWLTFFLNFIVIQKIESNECMWKDYAETKISGLIPLLTTTVNKPAKCLFKCLNDSMCDTATIYNNGDCLLYGTFRDTKCFSNYSHVYNDQSVVYKKYKKSFNEYCTHSKYCANLFGLVCYRTKCVCSNNQ